MQIDIVTMTPEWACQILAKQNTNNRTLRGAIVRRYAEAIRNNEWRLTQQGIAIDKNGVLLDGQHRLAAIVRAEKPVEIAMAVNCEPEIFKVLDTGATRKASDVLHMQGAKHRTVAATAIKQLIMYQENPDKVWRGRVRYPSHAEISEFYERNSTHVDRCTEIASRSYSSFRQLNKSAIATFVMLTMEKHYRISIVEHFMEKVSKGVDLSSDSAILKYRSSLMNDNIVKNARAVNNGGQLHINALIKAFNLTVSDVTVKLFKVPSIVPMQELIDARVLPIEYQDLSSVF
jgi:hypothetical protein